MALRRRGLQTKTKTKTEEKVEVVDKGSVEVVDEGPGIVDAQEVKPEPPKVMKPKDRASIVKADTSTAVIRTEDLNALNDGFDFGMDGGENYIQTDANIFKVHLTKDEYVEKEFLDCVLVGSRRVMSWWDGSFLYLQYLDTGKLNDPTVTVEELEEELGKGRFRVELALILEGYDGQLFTFLTSGTAFFNLKDYAKKLANPHEEILGTKEALRLKDVVTRITLKRERSEHGTYFVPVFEAIELLKEDE